jgi:hypothetical protein
MAFSTALAIAAMACAAADVIELVFRKPDTDYDYSVKKRTLQGPIIENLEDDDEAPTFPDFYNHLIDAGLEWGCIRPEEVSQWREILIPQRQDLETETEQER